MTDRNTLEEAAYDNACQQAQDEADLNRPYDIDQEETRIWAEILQGKHDSDMAQSESFDMANVMRIAYQASRLRDVLDGCVLVDLANSLPPPLDSQEVGPLRDFLMHVICHQEVGPLRDFDVQMADYVHQLAIRRVDG